jgi:hypothetical protein
MDAGLNIIDVSDPSDPTFIANFDTPTYAVDVVVNGDIAFIADFHSLQIVNVSDPNNPVFEGSCESFNRTERITIAGDHAFMPDNRFNTIFRNTSRLQTVDISNLSNPRLTGSYSAPSQVIDVYTAGGYLYVSNTWSGLQIFDIANPANPLLIGNCDTPASAMDAIIVDTYAYVADWSAGMQIVDISNPENPILSGSYILGLTRSVFVMGDYAFITNSNLNIMNVSEPTTPTLICCYDTPGIATDAVGSGDFLYVADGDFGLQIINVSNPGIPTLEGGYITQGWATRIFIEGNYAYITEDEVPPNRLFSGMEIIDISDPSSPLPIGSFETPGNAEGIFVEESYAYIADLESGIQILDVSVLSNPVQIANYDTPGRAYGILAYNDHIYVADEYSLMILLMTQTGIEEIRSIPISNLVLSNYPNPFNAATTISYSLPQAADIRIEIFDILGRRVETLFSGPQQAGEHAVSWKPGNISSGIYYYRIGSGDFSLSRSCLLIK